MEILNTKYNIMQNWRMKFLPKGLEWRIRLDLLGKLKRNSYTVEHYTKNNSLYIKYKGDKFGLDELSKISNKKYRFGGNGSKLLLNNSRVRFDYW